VRFGSFHRRVPKRSEEEEHQVTVKERSEGPARRCRIRLAMPGEGCSREGTLSLRTRRVILDALSVSGSGLRARGS